MKTKAELKVCEKKPQGWEVCTLCKMHTHRFRLGCRKFLTPQVYSLSRERNTLVEVLKKLRESFAKKGEGYVISYATPWGRNLVLPLGRHKYRKENKK